MYIISLVNKYFKYFGYEFKKYSIDGDRKYFNFNSILFSMRAIKYPEPVVIVQVGSNDGITNDPIFEFVISSNIKGVFIEPLSDVYNKCNISGKTYSIYIL